MTWEQARTGHLAGATCLWQDLDGLHVEPAPPDPPLTSVLWAWRDDDLVRVRLDGGITYIARCTSPSTVRLAPWDTRDQRVAGYQPAGEPSAGLGTAYEQVVVDGIDAGAGPITFVRPARQGSTLGRQTVT